MFPSTGTSTNTSEPLIPLKQIRALYDDSTITLYQAYPSAIALPALEHQRLSASPAFKSTRMTWVKPSWCWMMCAPLYPLSSSFLPLTRPERYRSGYSHKDHGQEPILALRINHVHFHALLAHSAPLEPSASPNPKPDAQVRIQWDPERGPRLERLPHRSIQIGIPPGLVRVWADEWIEGIEDVTEEARRLGEVLDGDWGGGLGEEDLVGMGLLPVERVYGVEGELGRRIGVGS